MLQPSWKAVVLEGLGTIRDRALTLLMTRYLIWGKQLPTAASHLPWYGSEGSIVSYPAKCCDI